MVKEVITNLYTNTFAQDRFQEFLSLISQKTEMVNRGLKVKNQYSSVVDSCWQLMDCWDAPGEKLPVYVVKLTSSGTIIDLDQEFVDLHFPDESNLLAAIYHPEQQEWYLSFWQQNLVLARNYYYTCNHQFSFWFCRQMKPLAESKKVRWSDLEAAFNPQKLREKFIKESEALINEFTGEIDQKLSQTLILQTAVLFFLQQQGWLGVKEDWSAGDKEFLLTLYNQMEASEDYWGDYLQPLLTSLETGGQKEEDYFSYQLPCLGETAQLMEGQPAVSNQLWRELLTTFNRYSFSLRESTPWQQQVALTPKLLSDLLERLVKDDQREKRGVVYTPPEIVNYLAQTGIINYLAAEFSQLKQKLFRRFVYYGELTAELRDKAGEIEAQLSEMKLCDPALGSGAFAVGIQQEIVKLRRKLSWFTEKELSLTELSQKTVINSIRGVEINEQAVKIARLRLWFNSTAAESDYRSTCHLSVLRYNCVAGNSLFSPEDNLFTAQVQKIRKLQERYRETAELAERYKLQQKIDNLLGDQSDEIFSFLHYFAAVFEAKGGFDLVMSNPPYVGEKGNKELFRRVKDYSLGRFYQGKMDLFYFFFHLGLDLAASGGHLIYITTNYFLRATGAYNLRTDLKERAGVKKLIDFNELKLFPAAIGQHNLISVLQKGNKDITARTVVTNRKGTAVSRDLSYLLYGNDSQTDYYLVPQSSLYEGQANYLRLRQGTVRKILQKMKEQGVQLGKLCNINQGIVTGCDRISPRHLQQYDLDVESGRGVFVVDKEQVKKFGLTDKASWFKPWFKNSDIDAWLPQQTSSQRLLYLDGEVERLPRAIKEHLTSVKEILVQRREVRQGRIKWWQLQWPREEQMFTGPKLVAPQRHRYNVFAYTEQPWYASADVYYLTRQNNRCQLKYLLALLNSELYYLWLYRKGKKKGDILELYQRPLSEVPIKVINFERQQDFIELVNQIIEAKHKLRQLAFISWEEILPEMEPPRRPLEKLARDYQVLYRGQAQKVRKIKVEIDNKSATIYSAREQKGWYTVLGLQLKERNLAWYLKYYLENLPGRIVQKVNNSNRGLVNRILNISLPIYCTPLRNRVVDKWSQLLSRRRELKNQVAKTEMQINKLVYNLYGLKTAEQAQIKQKL